MNPQLTMRTNRSISSIALFAFLSCAGLLVPKTAHAQLLTHDPINALLIASLHSDEMIQWANEIKNTEQIILNTEQTIKLGGVLNAEIGDWNGVLQGAKEIKMSAGNLSKNWAGGISASLVVNAGAGSAALSYNDHGNFTPPSTTNVFGANVNIDTGTITRYASVQQTYENAVSTISGTDTEIASINSNLADVYSQMTSTGLSQADYDRLKGRFDALNGRLQVIYNQRRDTLLAVQTQSTINQNQAALEQTTSQQVDRSSHQALTSAAASTAPAFTTSNGAATAINRPLPQ